MLCPHLCLYNDAKLSGGGRGDITFFKYILSLSLFLSQHILSFTEIDGEYLFSLHAIRMLRRVVAEDKCSKSVCQIMSHCVVSHFYQGNRICQFLHCCHKRNCACRASALPKSTPAGHKSVRRARMLRIRFCETPHIFSRALPSTHQEEIISSWTSIIIFWFSNALALHFYTCCIPH